jgi:hypothetical protein
MTSDPRMRVSRWIVLALLAVPLTMIGCDEEARSLAKKFFSAWEKVDGDDERMRLDTGRQALSVEHFEWGVFQPGTPGGDKDVLDIDGTDFTSTADTYAKDNGVIDDGETFASAGGILLTLYDDGWGTRDEPEEDGVYTLYWARSGDGLYIEWGHGGKAESDGKRLSIRFDLRWTEDYTLDGHRQADHRRQGVHRRRQQPQQPQGRQPLDPSGRRPASGRRGLRAEGTGTR